MGKGLSSRGPSDSRRLDFIIQNRFPCEEVGQWQLKGKAGGSTDQPDEVSTAKVRT